MEKPLVAIQCLVYNHGRFLRKCLDGFVNQETDFKYLAIVHDDASTDDSASIIREYETLYPEKIKGIYESENQFSKKDEALMRVVVSAVEEVGARYVAYCEGDDYWTDSHKLQKYVDYLNANPDYSMCYSAFQVIDQNNKPIYPQKYEAYCSESFSGNVLPQLFKHNFILTNTVCVRMDVFSSLSDFPVSIDYSLFFSAAFKGKAKFFPEKMSAYRIHTGGVTSSNWKSVNFQLEVAFLYWANYFFCHKSPSGCLDRILIVKRIITHDYSIPGIGEMHFPRYVRLLNKLYCRIRAARQVS